MFADVGVYVVYYRMTFGNYNTIEGSRTVTITAREVETMWRGDDNLIYNRLDRSGDVSAYFIDVNSQEVALPISFSGVLKDAGDYTVTAHLNSNNNYILIGNEKSVTISRLPIELYNFTVENEKEYDKTVTAAVSAWTSNIVAGEAVLKVEAFFNAADVTANSITVRFTLTGSRAGNYIKPDDYTITEDVRILPKGITLTDITAKSRLYDGTNIIKVEGCILNGVCQGDEVGYKLGDGFVDSPDVSDTEYDVTLQIELTGECACNYVVLPCRLSAKIMRREITVKIDDKSSRERENLLPLTYNIVGGTE